MIAMTPQMARTRSAIEKLSVDGVPPSFEELSVELGLKSRGSLKARLDEMKARGIITFEPHRARTLRVVDLNFDPRPLPTPELVRLFDRVRAELRRRAI